MRGLIKSDLEYPNLWNGCVGAWCPSVDRSRGTSLTDWSPNRNHGTLTNMEPATDWVVSGGQGALDFDGSNDYITITDNPSQTPGRTVCAWIKYDGSATLKYIIAKNNLWWLYVSTLEKLVFRFAGTSSDVILTGATSIPASQWIHACGVHHADASGTLQVFLNGVLDATSTIGGATANTNSATLIGRRFGGTDTFLGQIDDVRNYNRQLTQPEIQLLSRRRGIAYETRRNRSVKAPAAPSGNRRRRVLLTGST